MTQADTARYVYLKDVFPLGAADKHDPFAAEPDVAVGQHFLWVPVYGYSYLFREDDLDKVRAVAMETVPSAKATLSIIQFVDRVNPHPLRMGRPVAGRRINTLNTEPGPGEPKYLILFGDGISPGRTPSNVVATSAAHRFANERSAPAVIGLLKWSCPWD